MIRLERLDKSYPLAGGRVHVLRRIDLAVAQGDFVSIMGPSGAGKSTLLHILGLHDAEFSGEYELLGRPVHALGRGDRMELQKRNIGFVFQSYQLLDDLTVYENLEVPLSYRDVKRSERQAIVADVLDRFQIVGKKDLYPSQLSGGQQQLVGVARAVVAKPSLILADEPTGNLHSDQGREVMELPMAGIGEKTNVRVRVSQQNGKPWFDVDDDNDLGSGQPGDGTVALNGAVPPFLVKKNLVCFKDDEIEPGEWTSWVGIGELLSAASFHSLPADDERRRAHAVAFLRDTPPIINLKARVAPASRSMSDRPRSRRSRRETARSCSGTRGTSTSSFPRGSGSLRRTLRTTYSSVRALPSTRLFAGRPCRVPTHRALPNRQIGAAERVVASIGDEFSYSYSIPNGRGRRRSSSSTTPRTPGSR